MGKIKSGRPSTMNIVEDGIIRGYFDQIRHRCDVCNHPTRCVSIVGITMPEDIRIGFTIISKPNDRGVRVPIDHIGVGCGCYARFHRQIAHIMDAVWDEV